MSYFRHEIQRPAHNLAYHNILYVESLHVHTANL
jgi:hypothetical protein